MADDKELLVLARRSAPQFRRWPHPLSRRSLSAKSSPAVLLVRIVTPDVPAQEQLFADINTVDDDRPTRGLPDLWELRSPVR